MFVNNVPEFNWWSPGPAQVRFKALDAGPTTTFYSLDGSAEQTYTTTFTVSAEGTSTILFRSVDGSGNVETTQTGFVRVDTTAPVVVGDPTALYGSTPKYVLRAADAGVGMQLLSAKLDGGLLRSALYGPWRIEFAGPSLGTHTIEYTASDMLSHEITGTLTFSVKATPALSATGAGKTITLKRSHGKATTTLWVTARGVGGALLTGKSVVLEKSTNGRTWTTYGATRTTNALGKASVKLTFKKSGTTYWRWRLLETDQYGGVTARKTKVVVR
jgi:hypothetical protein